MSRSVSPLQADTLTGSRADKDVFGTIVLSVPGMFSSLLWREGMKARPAQGPAHWCSVNLQLDATNQNVLST